MLYVALGLLAVLVIITFVSQSKESQETETEKHYCQWCGKIFELPKEE